MMPLLEHPPPVHRYATGSWGPEAADQTRAPAMGAGIDPWVAS